MHGQVKPLAPGQCSRRESYAGRCSTVFAADEQPGTLQAVRLVTDVKVVCERCGSDGQVPCFGHR